MRKSEFRGWKNVFRFTLAETWKNRSFLIFMIISWAICFLMVPVMAIISKPKEEKEYNIEEVKVEKAYVLDEVMFTDLGFDAAAFKKEDIFNDVTVEKIRGIEYKDLADRVDEEPSSIMIHIGMDAVSGVSFNIVRAIESDVTETECDYIGSLLVEEFNEFKYEATDMGEEQLKAMECTYDVVALMEQENGEFISEKAHISETKYWITYAVMFIIMMICITSSTQVATAVAMDKSTKVMEYLLTSVRPMALVFGKVVAQVLSTVIQLGLSVVLALLSNILTAQFTGENFLKNKLPADLFSNITIPNVIISLVVVALGVMLYGFVAGLCGSMVSKMEELQESLSMLTVISIIGVYLAMFAAMSMQKTLTSPLFYVAVLLPVSSPFLLPGICLIGVGTWWVKALSVAILFVMDIVIMFAAARIYELLILYNGATIKPKELVKFIKQAKGGKTV